MAERVPARFQTRSALYETRRSSRRISVVLYDVVTSLPRR
jgi:hypothetical protein